MIVSTWTPERRARHSAAIRKWAPWTKSTGPRTVAGKAKSCMNALKHGQYCRQAYEFRSVLRRRMAYFKFLCHRQDELFLFQQNELLKARQGEGRISKNLRTIHIPKRGKP